MIGINAFYGAFFVFRRFTPGNGFLPIEMGSNRVAIFVLFYLISFIASVAGIGKTLADDAVAHPIYKLSVH